MILQMAYSEQRQKLFPAFVLAWISGVSKMSWTRKFSRHGTHRRWRKKCLPLGKKIKVTFHEKTKQTQDIKPQTGIWKQRTARQDHSHQLMQSQTALQHETSLVESRACWQSSLSSIGHKHDMLIYVKRVRKEQKS